MLSLTGVDGGPDGASGEPVAAAADVGEPMDPLSMLPDPADDGGGQAVDGGAQAGNGGGQASNDGSDGGCGAGGSGFFSVEALPPGSEITSPEEVLQRLVKGAMNDEVHSRASHWLALCRLFRLL